MADVNGDGYDDMIIGSPFLSRTSAGGINIVFGGVMALSTTTLSPSNSLVYTGSTGDEAGIALATGDLNADGYDDVVIGARKGSTAVGQTYILYGSASLAVGSGLLSTLPSYTGVALGEQSGSAVAVGDINADGYDDIVIGAPFNAMGGSGTGAFYIVYSSATQRTGTTSLSSAVRFYGTTDNGGNNASVGTSLAVGDVNGDGADDILAGAFTGSPNSLSASGFAYLLMGSTTNFTGAQFSSSSIRFDGEAASDALGTNVGVGDINNDGYDDIFLGASGNDDGASSAGAVYVKYGSSTTPTSALASTFIELNGSTVNDIVGSAMAVGDVNNDDYKDLLIGGPNQNGTGVTYIVYGSGTALTSLALGTTADVIMSSTTTNDSFGKWIATGDLNGDDIDEAVIGAPLYTSGQGAAYILYASFDGDHDGTPGSTGLLVTGTDCNDADATVTANQTYYADSDADTLGDPVVTTMVCSSTAPAGYVANATDTNDTIPNNGVEIGNDSIDNDGDGSIDEANTTTENGAHPYYSTLDSTDTAVVATAITAITATTDGLVQVTYADNSVYTFSAFTGGDDALAVVQYQDTGYVLALQPTGKNVALLNVFTGVVDTTVTLSKTKRYSVNSLKLLDVRNDGAVEAVITSRSKAKVLLSIVKVNLAGATLKKYDSVTATNKSVTPSKTTVKKKTLLLKSKKGKALLRYQTNKTYTLHLATA
ncbi:MAG: FG-GAP repeat protein [Candidatus Kerfeldbacteria bacterium]|nr:FG-GAP repeat protein [Candidatus Kerfeldbacteria bacterium]